MRVLRLLVFGCLLLAAPLAAQPLPFNGLLPPTPILICPDGTLPICGTFTTGSAGSIQAIPAVAGKKIHLAGYEIYTLSATNLSFTEGTGANCGTNGTTTINTFSNGGTTTTVHSPTFLLVAPYPTTTKGDALCVASSASTAVSGFVVGCQY